MATCQGITLSGSRCKRKVADGSFCHQHSKKPEPKTENPEPKVHKSKNH